MGSVYRFSCANCGFRAEVSGGDDRGFFVSTKTMYCQSCQTLCDVAVGYCDDPTHPRPSGIDDSREDRFGACPTCGSRDLVPWTSDDPCPKCRGPINRGKLAFLWD